MFIKVEKVIKCLKQLLSLHRLDFLGAQVSKGRQLHFPFIVPAILTLAVTFLIEARIPLSVASAASIIDVRAIGVCVCILFEVALILDISGARPLVPILHRDVEFFIREV